MSAGLEIVPLVKPSVSPLKGVLCCMLPPLALLCLLWGVRPCMAVTVQAFQADLVPCCRKRGLAPGHHLPEPCSLWVQSTLQKSRWHCT